MLSILMVLEVRGGRNLWKEVDELAPISNDYILIISVKSYIIGKVKIGCDIGFKLWEWFENK